MSSARESITETLVRYCTAIDTKEWPLLGQCFVPDCIVTYDGRPHHGLSALTEHLESGHRHLDGSLHRITNVAVQVDGDTAMSRCYVEVLLVRRDHPEGPTYHAHGTYIDSLVRPDRSWLIAQRNFTSTWTSGSRRLTRS